MLRPRKEPILLPKLLGSRVELRPLLEMNSGDWVKYHKYFRDKDIAELNGSKPLRMPLWLFRHVVSGEERGGDRVGFAVYLRENNAATQFIGSVELYDLRPMRPNKAREATLGALIGEKQFWGMGLGSQACGLLLNFAFGDFELDRVKLTTLASNTRARKAFEKIGFVLEYVSPASAHAGQDAHYRIDKDARLKSFVD